MPDRFGGAEPTCPWCGGFPLDDEEKAAGLTEHKLDCQRQLALATAKEKQIKDEGPCNAVIYHGPGHQSKTECYLVGPHEIHETRYGWANQLAQWEGRDVSLCKIFPYGGWRSASSKMKCKNCRRELELRDEKDDR